MAQGARGLACGRRRVKRLISIKISHYNEQARWALDLARVPYVEEPYMPILHFLPVMMAVGFSGKWDRVSTRFSTPVLVESGATPVCDSREIMRLAHREMLARGEGLRIDDPEVDVYIQRFHDHLGPHTRRAGYGFGLENLSVLRRLAWVNVGPWQARLFAVVAPFGRFAIRKSLGVTPESAARSADKVRAMFRDVGEILSAQEFIAGKTFSAADISFSALSAPSLLVQPDEGYGAAFPTLAESPAGARAFADELRGTVAGKHAIRMFGQFRRP